MKTLAAAWSARRIADGVAECVGDGATDARLRRAGAAVTAFDVDFNREVAADTGLFFGDDAEVSTALKTVEADPVAARERGAAGRREVARRYRWDDVTSGYEDMCRRLVSGTAQP